jgi:hypothetical protein
VRTLPGAAADAGAAAPAPRRPVVARRHAGLLHRDKPIVRDPSNGADDSFAVKDRRLGRSLRSRLRGAQPAPP